MKCYILNDYNILVPIKDINQDLYFVMELHYPIERTGTRLYIGNDNDYRITLVNNEFLEKVGFENLVAFEIDEFLPELAIKHEVFQMKVKKKQEERQEREKQEIKFCPVCGYDIVERSKGWYQHYRCKLCGKVFDVKVR